MPGRACRPSSVEQVLALLLPLLHDGVAAAAAALRIKELFLLRLEVLRVLSGEGLPTVNDIYAMFVFRFRLNLGHA